MLRLGLGLGLGIAMRQQQGNQQQTILPANGGTNGVGGEQVAPTINGVEQVVAFNG